MADDKATVLLNSEAFEIDDAVRKKHDHLNKAALDGYGTLPQLKYSELKTLVSAKQLIPGALYVLTDYVTKYLQPFTNKIQTADGAGTAERLVLSATSNSAFNQQCASLDFPSDIVFYDFTDTLCEDGFTARNGFIQRRIDTKYIVDMPHDWRRMLWPRFKASAPAWEPGTAVSRLSMYQYETNLYVATRNGTPNNAADTNFFQLICSTDDYFWSRASTPAGLTFDTTDYAERYTFNAKTDLTVKTPTKKDAICPERIVVQGGTIFTDSALYGLTNNVFMFDNVAQRPVRIFAAPGFYSNTFGLTCRNSTFGSGCNNNSFVSCHSNTFGSNCYNNIYGSATSSTFGSSCHSNIFDSDCSGNVFGSNCHSNIFGSNCSYNTFGSNCCNNIFGSNCNSNAFGSQCHSNAFGSYCHSNIFGSNCNSNTFANDFRSNTLEPRIISKDMSAITELHSKSYNHRIFVNKGGTAYSVHYDGTTPVYTAIP